LRPEVFTPNGRAPYLVTVGGVMSRDEAFAMARKARSEGLPRDSYAQNYRDKSR
jgi:eukaryotic-like serine/threonine-protein kinase